MPIVFIDQFDTEEVVSEEVINEDAEEIQYEKADYGDLSIIKLLHSDSGEVQEIEFDTYLYGVVSAEMPASYELEALKAQAVVARTYTIYKIANGR